MQFYFEIVVEVNITMYKYIDNIINEYDVNGYSAIPFTNDLFKLMILIDQIMIVK